MALLQLFGKCLPLSVTDGFGGAIADRQADGPHCQRGARDGYLPSDLSRDKR